MFWRPSPLVAAEPSWSARRCLAIPSMGIRTTLETASPIPAQLSSGCSAAMSARVDSIAEKEELHRDELLRALLGAAGEHPLAREAPDDDHAGEALDRAVQTEADEDDRRRDDAGGERDDALDGHPRQADPRQRPRLLGQPAIASLVEARRAQARSDAG